MVTAVEIRGYEPLFTEDNRRLCGCLAPLLSLPASQTQTKYPVLHHSIAHSSLFPTSMYLHWHFRPKKWFFWNKKFLPPKKYFFLPFFNATFQWGPRKSEKAGLKSCSAQTLFSTVQPRPQPTAQNWFSILWNLGTRHLFSYLWPQTFQKNVSKCKILNLIGGLDGISDLRWFKGSVFTVWYILQLHVLVFKFCLVLDRYSYKIYI